MQIAQKGSCEVATAAKPDPPGYHYQFKPCQLSSRVVDPSAINGTHGTLNPRTERNAKNYAGRSTSALQMHWTGFPVIRDITVKKHVKFLIPEHQNIWCMSQKPTSKSHVIT